MQTPTFDGDVYEQDQRYKDDQRLFVQFFREPVQNKVKSTLEGRPIFDEVDMVRIITPGSRDVMVTRADDNYRRRFPKQWERFQLQQEQAVEGTPLEQVPWLTVGQVAELKAVHVMTLEQLAALPDNLAQKFMGAHQLRQRAQAMIDAAKGEAPMLRLQAELEARDQKIELMQKQIDQLVAASKKKGD